MYISKGVWKNSAGKSYRSIWLKETFRENGKVKSRYLLNLKEWSDEAINALQLAITLQRKTTNTSNFSDNHESKTINIDPQQISLEQGLSVGALFTVHQIAERLGIIEALGNNTQGKLALWQVCARVLEQGSRLSAARMANFHAVAAIINFEHSFSENDLYDNLHWLDTNQKNIEDKLFSVRYSKTTAPNLFLYDVTSSYLEGEKNELAQFGYNRDKKKGKRQIVIGLLCDNKGVPVSVEVFEGNTQDVSTVLSQIKKVRERFGCEKVTLVGDRGMLKSTNLKDLKEVDFTYISAITRAQIEKLIKVGTLEYSLFDEDLCEVDCDGVRYIFRRNPVRAEEIQATRKSKLEQTKELLEQKNVYLSEHAKAHSMTALSNVSKKIKQLKLEQWVKVSISQTETRRIELFVDEKALEEWERLDGCYVLKTDVPKEMSDKEEIHGCYKDLAMVESAFRMCKTVSLELRPLHVRLSTSTRGHVFVVMLAYMIIQELNRLWKEMEVTVEEGLTHLSALTEQKIIFPDGLKIRKIPSPSEQNEKLLIAADIKLPPYLANNDVTVATYKHKKKPS